MQDKEYYKTYCDKNKEKIKERKRKYYLLKKDEILKKQKEYYLNNSDFICERQKNKYFDDINKSRQRGVDYYEKNKYFIKNKQKESYYLNNKSDKIKKRRQTDPIFKLKTYLGNRLRDFIKQKKFVKNSKIFEVIGCSPNELKKHFELKFVEGMSWNNHGEWHIDHIIPLSSAKNMEELYKLNHYSNLQPLWKTDNLKKSNKLIINN